MANLKYFLWLTTRERVRPDLAGELLVRLGSPEAVFFADRQELSLLGLQPGELQALEDKDLSGAEKILEDCDRLNIHITTIQDADYPERLSQIYDPPVVLYWKGRGLGVDDLLTIGVVGTRSCTPYGADLAGKLGLNCARSGVTLVSGMAQGIDRAAIVGALKGGGQVLSVLGGGLDVVYPKDHGWLYQDVAAVGTLLSEYPPGTRHAGFHFPRRNRILSGLSLGVVVVEAPAASGALNTARHALDQGREVFAFPGPVGAAASMGANLLIQRGEAKLVLSWTDILVEFASRFPKVEEAQPLDPREVQERLDTPPETRVQKAPDEKKVDKAPDRAYISVSDDPGAFTDDERAILSALEKAALTIDDLTEHSQIPARRVLSCLTMLQLRGMVEERPGKRFAALVILKP